MYPDYTFESFIQANENKFACHCAEAVVNVPSDVYNPLFLYGPSGTGKTHLLHAIANGIHSKLPDHRVFYSTCDEFLSYMIQDLLNKNSYFLETIYLEPDTLLLDDVHRLVGMESTQEMLRGILEDRTAAGKKTVLTSTAPAPDLPVLHFYLKNGCSSLCAEIVTPQPETRLAVAREKAKALDLSVSDGPLMYISNHADNIRQIEGALKWILAYRDFGLIENTTPNIMKMLYEEWLPTIAHSQTAS